jgi:molybdopterin/thiamine biosynthesis adenylyltransferase
MIEVNQTKASTLVLRNLKMEEDPNRQLSKMVWQKSFQMTDPADRPVRVIEEEKAFKIAEHNACNLSDVYVAALEQSVWPYRYLRNRDILSESDQLQLAKSKIAVIGSGGLGGTVILLLARIGLGSLIVVDGDVFDETNLNRQALAELSNLGSPKAEEAAKKVNAVNPSVKIITHRILIEATNIERILSGAHVVVDALDNIPDRIMLAKAAQKLKIPLVHGALAGFDGQVMTVFPEDQGLERIYGNAETQKDNPDRPEAVLGVPALTPSIVATMQAMEVIKILLKRGQTLRNRMLHIDLDSGRFDSFQF